MTKKLLHEIYYSALCGAYGADGHFLIETNSDKIRDGAIMSNLVYRYRDTTENPNKEEFVGFLRGRGIEARIIEPDYTINI